MRVAHAGPWRGQARLRRVALQRLAQQRRVQRSSGIRQVHGAQQELRKAHDIIAMQDQPVSGERLACSVAGAARLGERGVQAHRLEQVAYQEVAVEVRVLAGVPSVCAGQGGAEEIGVARVVDPALAGPFLARVVAAREGEPRRVVLRVEERQQVGAILVDLIERGQEVP